MGLHTMILVERGHFGRPGQRATTGNPKQWDTYTISIVRVVM